MGRFIARHRFQFNILTTALLILFFQNCGKGFEVATLSSTAVTYSGSNTAPIDQNPIEDIAWSVESAEAKQGRDLTFKIKLAQANSNTVSFLIQTIDGTAKSSEDFMPYSNTISIQPGLLETTVTIPTLAYTANIDPLNFLLEVTQKTKKSATGTILPIYSKMPGFKKIIRSNWNHGYCGITIDGKARCWGGIRGWENTQGIWGASDQYGSVEILGLTDLVDIVGGYARYCALDIRGKMSCWGMAGGNYAQRLVVKEVDFFPGLKMAKLIKYSEALNATNDGYICAVSTANEYYCRTISFDEKTLGALVNNGVVIDAFSQISVAANNSLNYTSQVIALASSISGVTNAQKILGGTITNTVSINGISTRTVEVMIRDLIGKVRCIQFDAFKMTVTSDREINELFNASEVYGLCSGGVAILSGGKISDYKRDTNGNYVFLDHVIMPNRNFSSTTIAKDILAFGKCFRMMDDSLVCDGAGTFVPSGPRELESQFPYDVNTVRNISISQMSGECFVDKTGKLYCSIVAPQRLSGIPEDVVKIDGPKTRSDTSYCALTKSRSVKCWSYNLVLSGTVQIADITGAQGAIDINVGSSSSCAVLAEGNVVCWVKNIDVTKAYPELGVAKKVVVNSIQTTDTTTLICALGIDGKVRCSDPGNVDSPNYEITGFNSGEKVVDLSMQGSKLYMLLEDGTIRQKNGTTAIVGDYSSLKGIVEISSAYYHSCARSKIGEIYCWGQNGYGQFGNGYKSYYSSTGNVDGEVKIPILAFNGTLADSIFTGNYWVAIVPKRGSNLRAAGQLWSDNTPRSGVTVLDYR